MGIIPGIEYSDTAQIVVIVIIGIVVLFTLIGIVCCCCCSSDGSKNRLRDIQAQRAKYAPNDNWFTVLVFTVPQWSEIHQASTMHAEGADLRFKKMLAKRAVDEGAYYVVDTPNHQTNRKIVVSRDPETLFEVARQVYEKMSIQDFSNNMEANARMNGVYHNESSIWSGMRLCAAIHHGQGTVSGSSEEADNTPLLVEGAVVDDAIFLAEQLDLQDGNVVVSNSALESVGEKWRRVAKDVTDVVVDKQRLFSGREELLQAAEPLKKWTILRAAPPITITLASGRTSAMGGGGEAVVASTTDSNNTTVERIQQRRQLQQRQEAPTVTTPVEPFRPDDGEDTLVDV